MKNIKRPEVIEIMQSELDKIYEEEYEERLEKRFSMGREEGVREGIATGLSEASIRIAKKMLSDGLSIDQIAKYTGLSSGEIQAI